MNIRGLVLASLGVTLAILVGLSHGSCNPNTGIESFVCTFRESYKIKTSTNCGWWFSSSKCTKYRTGYRIRYSTCTRYCKVDGGWGGWSGWSVWSSCSKTCGSGTKTSIRKRICNNPIPKNGGKPCNVASNTEIKTKSVSCQIVPCPVHGGWSNWSQWGNWGTCSKTCNNGSMTSMRTRTCTNPPPQFGGNECVGSSEDTRSSLCNTFSCPEDICKVVGTGYRPHPADVGKFLYCVAGVVNILNCSEGLEWDQNILTCNWPSIQECTNGEYLPHDTDCTKFLQCSNGVAVEMNCPDGLHWNKSVLVCDYSEDASCDVSDDDSADNDGNNSFQCPQAFGYYPNPNDCGKFYQCSWSVPYEQQCGTDQGWNDEIQTCVLKSELSNCG